jgi:hypothetical protein
MPSALAETMSIMMPPCDKNYRPARVIKWSDYILAAAAIESVFAR